MVGGCGRVGVQEREGKGGKVDSGPGRAGAAGAAHVHAELVILLGSEVVAHLGGGAPLTDLYEILGDQPGAPFCITHEAPPLARCALIRQQLQFGPCRRAQLTRLHRDKVVYHAQLLARYRPSGAPHSRPNR